MTAAKGVTRHPRGDERVKLDGRVKILRYDMNAIVEAEAALGGKAVMEILQEMSQRLSFTSLRVLLWAGLLHEEPDLDLQTVGAWFKPGVPLKPLVESIAAAVNAALGVDPQDVEQAEADPQRGGASGTGSKPSAAPPSPASGPKSSGA